MSEPVYCPDVNMFGVAKRAWAQFVTEPVGDFMNGVITIHDYVASLDEEPSVVTHWGTVLTLSEVMRYYLKEVIPNTDDFQV